MAKEGLEFMEEWLSLDKLTLDNSMAQMIMELTGLKKTTFYKLARQQE